MPLTCQGFCGAAGSDWQLRDGEQLALVAVHAAGQPSAKPQNGDSMRSGNFHLYVKEPVLT